MMPCGIVWLLLYAIMQLVHTVGHIFNPLTTDDALWHCLTFAVCYHAVGAICFKDKFCASKKGGIGRGGRVSTQLVWLPWLAVEQPWSLLPGWFLNMLSQLGTKPLNSSCRGTISRPVGIFQLGGTFTGQRALTIQGSLMSAWAWLRS